MASDIEIPSTADVKGMTPDEYKGDLKRRYYTERYTDAEHVQEISARIEDLREAAQEAQAEAEALSEDAEKKRQEAKDAVVEDEDADPYFDAAAELEQQADRKRSIAVAKAEAADELEEGAKQEALEKDAQIRTVALRKERRQRIDEMLEALEVFEERFRKAKAADDRMSDPGVGTPQVLRGVNLLTKGTQGEQTQLGGLIRNKVEGIPA